VNPAYDKYQDQHVRDNLVMAVSVATAYLQNYTGDFHVLIELRDRITRGHDLTVVQVRTVLNCMRNDPRIGDLPIPLTPYDARSYALSRQSDNVIDFTSRRPRRSAQPQRPFSIRLPTSWNRTHGITHHIRSARIHVLDTEKSFIEYWTASDQFRVRMRWVCSADMPQIRVKDENGYTQLSHEYDIELLTADEASDMIATLADAGWAYCKQCLRTMEYRAEKEMAQ
jgi:hypothetical protein